MFTLILNNVFAEAESTVSRAQLLDDDGQSAKSFSTSSSGTTEERGYREGACKFVHLISSSL